jgi:N4-gp56 family major capsid protein
MSWQFDAPSGVYKNHALSSQIREQAAADALFAQFLDPVRGFGKGKGATVTIHRVLQLPLAGKVDELDNLPTGYAAIQKVSATVSEWGFAIELTSFEEDLAFFDLRNKQQRMLRDQMTLTMDKMSADALKLTPIDAIATSAASLTMETDGTVSNQAAANLTVAHLRQLHDYFRQTLKCPKFRNNRYVGILSTRAARGIKNDPEFKDWQAGCCATLRASSSTSRITPPRSMTTLDHRVSVARPSSSARTRGSSRQCRIQSCAPA